MSALSTSANAAPEYKNSPEQEEQNGSGKRRPQDPELRAMGECLRVLEEQDAFAQARILNWLGSRLEMVVLTKTSVIEDDGEA